MPFHTALIDADNTLFDFTRAEHAAITDCLMARGLPHDETVTDRYAQINDAHWKLLERREISREALRLRRFEVFFREFGFDCDPEQMATDYMATLATKSYLIDGALDFCTHLYGKCRLYLVTNGNAHVQKARFAACPLRPLFEACFISEELGYAKPERAYFDAVAAAIPHFSPADTIVIGDSLSSDIRGGINAGLTTCWYNPTHKAAPAELHIDYICDSFDGIESIVLGR